MEIDSLARDGVCATESLIVSLGGTETHPFARVDLWQLVAELRVETVNLFNQLRQGL